MDGSEYVYSSDQDYDNVESPSEPVQGLATRVYKEFERMIAKYDQDSVRDLMPLVVTMLETLDQSIKEKNESLVEIELLEEDKKQLKSQYERERKMKRQAEQRLMESEDAVESLTRDLKETNEKLEVTSRQLDMRTKSHADQIERLQEREAESKKEYQELHQRHSEMIRTYCEYIEKTKTYQQQSITDAFASQSPIVRKKDVAVGMLSPFSPDTVSSRSLASTPVVEDFGNALMPKRAQWGVEANPFQPNVQQEIAEATGSGEDTSQADKTVSSDKDENHTDILSDGTSAESASSSGPDSGQILCNEFQQNVLNLGCPVETSTPSSLNLDESVFAKTPISASIENCGIENEAFDPVVVTNNNSLFAELSKSDIGDVDDGADLLGMGKELENLMLENTKLMATKNALDIVKDDLIHQVDQLTNQLTMLQEDLDRSHQAKDRLSRRAVELEGALKEAERKVKETGDTSPLSQSSKTPDEEDVVPLSQRKRFTRVEMARVLMERNQYKEKLMELQEAVRWTEMLRASRDHPEAEAMSRPKSKNRSSFSQFFSRLFGPSNPSGPNSSPSRARRPTNVGSSEDIKMRHSKSDSFTTSQSVAGK